MPTTYGHAAERIRTMLAAEPSTREVSMFGGLSFLVDGHLAVAVSGQGGLLVQVTDAERDALLAEPHVAPMVMGGRESRSWLHVQEQAVDSAEQLRTWVGRGLATARARD